MFFYCRSALTPRPNPTDTGKVVEYEIKIMDIDSEHLSIPESEYEVVVKMPSVELQRVCRDLAQLTDSVTITIDKEEMQFRASGNFASGGVKITPSNSGSDEKSASCTINASRKVSLCLSLPYLNNFTKATPLSDMVVLCASEDQPIMLEYKLETTGFVKLVCASPCCSDTDSPQVLPCAEGERVRASPGAARHHRGHKASHEAAEHHQGPQWIPTCTMIPPYTSHGHLLSQRSRAALL